MASQSVKLQYVTIGFAEGYTDIMWDQRYREQPNNKTFKSMRQRLSSQCDRIREVLSKEGKLSPKDLKRIGGAIDDLKIDFMDDGKFEPMMAVAFVIDMIVYQLAKMRNLKKKELYETLLVRIREFERYFDRNREYDDPTGMIAAERFREMQL